MTCRRGLFALVRLLDVSAPDSKCQHPGTRGRQRAAYSLARTPALLVPIRTHSRRQIAVWFDDVMDYVSAWATPKIQWVLLAIALLVTCV